MASANRLIVAALVFVSSYNVTAANEEAYSANINRLMPVDCLLPGQVRRLGSTTYIAARKAIKTTAGECELRGGEYVAYDRATQASALKVWLPLAKQGNAEAATYVGEIYEKGLDQQADYAAAAAWYVKAAEQGSTRAALNLGNLFAQGLGLEQDQELARFWFRQASGLPALDYGKEAAQDLQQSNGLPDIQIVEPLLAYAGGQPYTTADKSKGPLLIIGQVDSTADDITLSVNGRNTPLLKGGLFRLLLQPADLTDAIRFVAQDSRGRQKQLTVAIGKPATPVQKTAERTRGIGLRTDRNIPSKGRSHALVIGNNAYSVLPELETAESDARAVAKLLEEDYGFSVQLLIDVGRYEVMSALNELRKGFAPDDRLLVYYAGHGELDKLNKRGHWLPVDAEMDSPANWISNISVTDLLNMMPARQIMVIADSCYSGMMSRSALGTIDPTLPERRRRELLAALEKSTTRTALSSGGVTPVIDTLDGQHSVFARAFLDTLKANRGIATGLDVFNAVRPRVLEESSKIGVTQEPEYAPLSYAGHKAGDFLFIRKQ